jgi:hypothetical protein
VLEVPPSPHTSLDFSHVIVVQELNVDKKLRHISRVPYNFSKACWAMHAVNKKNVMQRLLSMARAPRP